MSLKNLGISIFMSGQYRGSFSIFVNLIVKNLIIVILFQFHFNIWKRITSNVAFQDTIQHFSRAIREGITFRWLLFQIIQLGAGGEMVSDNRLVNISLCISLRIIEFVSSDFSCKHASQRKTQNISNLWFINFKGVKTTELVACRRFPFQTFITLGLKLCKLILIFWIIEPRFNGN